MGQENAETYLELGAAPRPGRSARKTGVGLGSDGAELRFDGLEVDADRERVAGETGSFPQTSCEGLSGSWKFWKLVSIFVASQRPAKMPESVRTFCEFLPSLAKIRPAVSCTVTGEVVVLPIVTGKSSVATTSRARGIEVQAPMTKALKARHFDPSFMPSQSEVPRHGRASKTAALLICSGAHPSSFVLVRSGRVRGSLREGDRR